MLKDQDRIFKNLYNDLGEDVFSSKKRDDWLNTKELCESSTYIPVFFRNLYSASGRIRSIMAKSILPLEE